MTTATAKLSAPPRAPVRGLAVRVTFERGVVRYKALGGLVRYRRTYFSDLGNYPADVDRVLIPASERLFQEVGSNLHAAYIRSLGLSEDRFKDFRLDGLIYAYLIPGTPIALIERMVDNALDHIHLVASRQEVNARLAFATREINELNEIGAALSAEHDTGKLLDMILTKCREITSSDAGSLYVVEENEQDSKKLQLKSVWDEPVVRDAERRLRMRFKLAPHDSVSPPFREVTMEISEKSIARYVALTGLPVNIEDAYHLPSR